MVTCVELPPPSAQCRSIKEVDHQTRGYQLHIQQHSGPFFRMNLIHHPDHLQLQQFATGRSSKPNVSLVSDTNHWRHRAQNGGFPEGLQRVRDELQPRK